MAPRFTRSAFADRPFRFLFVPIRTLVTVQILLASTVLHLSGLKRISHTCTFFISFFFDGRHVGLVYTVIDFDCELAIFNTKNMNICG